MMLNFDATKIPPEQSNFSNHPVGKKFQATISDVGVKENSNKDGGYFQVVFTTPAGSIPIRYNLFFTNPNVGQIKSQEIANKQLSALCHATGIFRLGDGRELVNARLMIDVDWQKGQAPTPEKPEGGYTEVTKVYDANGNEPGKAPTAAPQAANGGSGWNNQTAPQPQPQAQPAQQGAGWTQGPNQNAPAATSAPQNGGQNWSQGPANASAPSWAQNK